jgi:hypothetical protein
MAAIRSGHLTIFYLFDVAEVVSLDSVRSLVGAAEPVRLTTKTAIPSYVEYQQAPLIVAGDTVGMKAIDGLSVRFKLFDYGVISLALSRPFSGSWTDLIALADVAIENERLEQGAEACCRSLIERLRPALKKPRQRFLTEDYVVFTITALDEPLSADALLERHAEEIALILRGERQSLSGQERDAVLRNRLSYLATDLVVPTWNTALVYDNEAGADGALEILEFANSQLLEFRYYDELLDAELKRIYAELQRPRTSLLSARRQTRAAQSVQALLIDVHELTDHTENALKFVGDIYAARLFALVGVRLGLDVWKASVQEKLKTLDDIRRFAVEHSSMARGELLELTIVLILVLELILFFLGIMK